MARRFHVFYFYSNGEKVATMIVYGDAEEFARILQHEKLSPWKLFDKVDNKYYFVRKAIE